MPEADFWHLNPRKLNPYIDALKIKSRVNDEEMWALGQYVHEAVGSAVDKVLAGKKSKWKYLDAPLLQKAEEKQAEEKGKSKPLTQEEQKRKVEQLFLKLQIMQSNYQLEKLNKQKDEEESVS